MDQTTLSELQALRQLADAGVIDSSTAQRVQEECLQARRRLANGAGAAAGLRVPRGVSFSALGGQV